MASCSVGFWGGGTMTPVDSPWICPCSNHVRVKHLTNMLFLGVDKHTHSLVETISVLTNAAGKDILYCTFQCKLIPSCVHTSLCVFLLFPYKHSLFPLLLYIPLFLISFVNFFYTLSSSFFSTKVIVQVLTHYLYSGRSLSNCTAASCSTSRESLTTMAFTYGD